MYANGKRNVHEVNRNIKKKKKKKRVQVQTFVCKALFTDWKPFTSYEMNDSSILATVLLPANSLL